MIIFNKEQIYIVTGASSGIGEATAILLNELGATVVGIGRNQERLEGMKAKCKSPENMFLEQKDLTEDIEGLPKYVKSLKEKYGKFSGMAYCAGVSALNPLRTITYEYLTNIFDINYFAPIMMIKSIGDKRNNVGLGTSIVTISSIDAILNSKGQSVYGASKAALSASIKALSRELTQQNGVRINAVLPSMIKTSMTMNSQVQGLGINQNINFEEYPFGWGEPNDVANMIVYLLSDKAKFISGQNYVIDSGGVL